MKKLLTLFVLTCFTTYTYSCTCIGKSKLKNSIRHSDVIISGKILSQNQFQVSNDSLTGLSFSQIEYLVLVTNKLKGQVNNDTLRIVTGIGNGDCGYNFTIGKDYLIFLHYDDYEALGQKTSKYLSTDICTRTMLFNDKEFNRIKKTIKYLHKTNSLNAIKKEVTSWEASAGPRNYKITVYGKAIEIAIDDESVTYKLKNNAFMIGKEKMCLSSEGLKLYINYCSRQLRESILEIVSLTFRRII